MKTKWRFTVHPIGFVCLAAAFLFLPVSRLAAVLIAAAVHEAAHLLAIHRCSIRHCSVEWTPFGFVAQAERFALLPCQKRMIIAAAGLMASAAMAGVCWALRGLGFFFVLLLHANMALLLINALPVLPLDGGRVLLAAAALFGRESSMQKVLLFLSYTVSAMLVILGIYGLFLHCVNPTLLVLGPYLAYAAKQSELQNTVEGMQLLEEKIRNKKNRMLRADVWLTHAPPDDLSLVRALRLCPEDKKTLILHMNTKQHSVKDCLTEEQILVKLMKDNGHNA